MFRKELKFMKKGFMLAECATHVTLCNNIGDNLACHPELDSWSINADIEPLTLPSAQGRQGHTHRIALRFPLSPTRGEVKAYNINSPTG